MRYSAMQIQTISAQCDIPQRYSAMQIQTISTQCDIPQCRYRQYPLNAIFRNADTDNIRSMRYSAMQIQTISAQCDIPQCRYRQYPLNAIFRNADTDAQRENVTSSTNTAMESSTPAIHHISRERNLKSIHVQLTLRKIAVTI